MAFVPQRAEFGVQRTMASSSSAGPGGFERDEMQQTSEHGWANWNDEIDESMLLDELTSDEAVEHLA